MKKTLIALAVGAAFVAPAAYADVTISGSINMGIAYAKSNSGTGLGTSNSVETSTGGEGVSQTSVTNNYSNVTIGSMEDLGGGLKLDFAFQMVAPTNSNGNVANRNSHIGLVSESWGGVWYGTNENLYERYYYSIDPLDGAAGIGGNLQMLGTPGYGVVFDAPAGRAATVAGQAGFYRRSEHTVWYDSPNWNGFTFGAYSMLTPYKVSGGTMTNPSMWGVGGKYVGPAIPIQIWVAYEKHKDFNGLNVITSGASAAATSSSDRGIQVGVGYTLGDIFLFANYEQLKYESDGLAATAVNEYKRNAWSIGGKWNIATGYVGAQYIQAQDGKCEFTAAGGCNADNSGGRMFGLGYYHTLSKQTQAYVMGTLVRNEDLASYVLAGAGTPSAAPGADHTAVTVGLKHSF